MTDAPETFRIIADQFGSLSYELKNCTDPQKRRDLLREFRALLAQADGIVSEESAED